MKVVFIGLGIMGRPMAGHLVKAGHELYVHDLRPAPQDLLDQGARDCRSGREVAEQAEVIITMVPALRMWKRPCSAPAASPKG